MALTEFESTRVEMLVSAYVESRRPPVALRSQVDLAFRMVGQSVEIFEVRSGFRDPASTVEESVAKATFVRTENHWKLFWLRADLKWHCYDPVPVVETIEEFLKVLKEDEYACFWG